MAANLQVQLAMQRDGMPEAGDFHVVEAPIPRPAPGQMLVRTVYLSLDPYVRKAIRGDHPGHKALVEGDVIYGRSVCRVVRSHDDSYRVGDYLVAETGWRQHAAIGAEKVVQRIDPSAGPLSAAIGTLGMPGLTAWGSVEHLGKPSLGETLVVSAAAGPVGGCVGQLAKLRGARVVGIAGSPEKCDLVTKTYGFDACVNYKETGWEEKLKAVCPNGVDVYHDNVGGALLVDMAKHLSLYGRVIMCGRPADYHSSKFHGVGLGPFIGRRAKLYGLVVYDYEHDLERYLRLASAWMREGKLKVKEDRADRLENAPAQFLKLMRGENVGKAIVAVGPEKA
ncbi:MAG: NADP-dependent oxidoreductase [Rhodospirillaceae bacterium]|mgnify:CR=1 FL=1|nr:NADP-dependent oxidoreductase [Rhodospirillaceae bacterium]MBT5242177.1 NADP-dependent oxidoreductase [Rhodospirillaceae bacterium]MBT5565905.1 NADP-dependent oxidoreductase [Rhodospirillaceae bacterium]MBT6088675.1 NADP-dependent oxidoreductase [Rhodospirillaceae bacterium]MBT6961632.1 NADP-dependent oxidoreductase [Rhodospirillaceae bacterium]